MKKKKIIVTPVSPEHNECLIHIQHIKNAIKAVKKTQASYFRSGFKSGCDLLFFDKGNDFEFGIDSCYSLQIEWMCGRISTKTDVILELKKELEFNLEYELNLTKYESKTNR